MRPLPGAGRRGGRRGCGGRGWGGLGRGRFDRGSFSRRRRGDSCRIRGRSRGRGSRRLVRRLLIGAAAERLRDRNAAIGITFADRVAGRHFIPVSYTHLTLPTIYSV